jgi:PcfJ-like protein
VLPYEVGDIMPDVLLKDRLATVFAGPGRETLRAAALVMASSHQYALDYIEQAPVIVLLAGAAVSNQGILGVSLDQRVRKRLAEYFHHKCERKLPLRELMAELWSSSRKHPGPGVYQLRKLKGAALRQAYWNACVMLANIDGMTLAQIIPKGARRQLGWLRCVSAWSKQISMRRDVITPPERIGEMIAEMAFSARVIAELGLSTQHEGEEMADFMADRSRYSVLWSSPHFMREWGDWTRMRRKLFAESDAAVDYAPLPNEPVTHAGYEFVPLRSHAALIEESEQMGHCVHSYWRDVVDRQSFIFSVRSTKVENLRVATLEVRDEVGGSWRTPEQLDAGVSFDDAMAGRPMPVWCVEQLKAAHNKPPSKQMREACASFVATIDMPSIDDERARK